MTQGGRQPDLKLLTTFLLFAEKKEGKAVADEMDIDESGVSNRLKKLRKQYGLVEKQGQRWVLSPKGEEALPAIRALLGQYEHFVEWLADRQAAPQRVTVATGSLGAQLYLPRALKQFAEEQPGWQAQVQVRRGRERILGTASGQFDLAIVSHDRSQIRSLLDRELEKKARLEVEDLVDQWLCLIARPGTPAAELLTAALESQAFPLARLSEFDLIGPDGQSGIRRQLERSFVGRPPPRFRIETAGWAAVRECVRQGLGAAVVPVSVLALADRKELVIRRLAGDVGIKDYLIYRPGAASAGREAMRQAICRAAEAMRAELQSRWRGVLFL